MKLRERGIYFFLIVCVFVPFFVGGGGGLNFPLFCSAEMVLAVGA